MQGWTDESATDGEPPRPVWRAMTRGSALKCPNCGEGRIFTGYLRVSTACAHCGEELHHQRADDAPPYVTIFIVGHVVLPLLMALERAAQPAVWLHLALWLPLTVILSLALLPVVKGSLIGLQWALRMHGFGGEPDTVPLSFESGAIRAKSVQNSEGITN